MAYLPKQRKKRSSTPNTTRLANYYNNKVWKALRVYKRVNNPLCEECLKEGRIEPMKEVHHIIKWDSVENLAEKWRLFTDVENLMSVCIECHKKLDKKV